MSKKNHLQRKKVFSHSLVKTKSRGQKSGTPGKDIMEYKDWLSHAEGREEIERFLKNEAYSFLLSEGLIGKFLEYRNTSQQSKQQGAAYFLAVNANLRGLWIDA